MFYGGEMPLNVIMKLSPQVLMIQHGTTRGDPVQTLVSHVALVLH